MEIGSKLSQNLILKSFRKAWKMVDGLWQLNSQLPRISTTVERQGNRGGKEDSRMNCVWPAGPAKQVDNFVKLQAINSTTFQFDWIWGEFGDLYWDRVLHSSNIDSETSSETRLEPRVSEFRLRDARTRNLCYKHCGPWPWGRSQITRDCVPPDTVPQSSSRFPGPLQTSRKA